MFKFATPPKRTHNLICFIWERVGLGKAKYIHVVPMDPETLARLPVDAECQGSDSGGHESDGKPHDQRRLGYSQELVLQISP